MSDELFVRFCSPTLAGLKVANLFSCKYTDPLDLQKKITYFNEQLNKKGIVIEILKQTNGNALIFVYRKYKLKALLNQPKIHEFLKLYGYNNSNLQDCITLLKQHLVSSDFPHEIGILLGYPLEDVKAFIQYQGRGHKYLGHWKVYYNVQESKDLFSKFDKCTRIYQEQFIQGINLTKLTITA